MNTGDRTLWPIPGTNDPIDLLVIKKLLMQNADYYQ